MKDKDWHNLYMGLVGWSFWPFHSASLEAGGLIHFAGLPGCALLAPEASCLREALPWVYPPQLFQMAWLVGSSWAMGMLQGAQPTGK